MAQTTDTYVAEIRANTSQFTSAMRAAQEQSERAEETFSETGETSEGMGTKMSKTSRQVSSFSGAMASLNGKTSSVSARISSITSSVTGLGSKLGSIVGITSIATLVNKGINGIISGVQSLSSEMEEATTAWATFEANMQMNGHTTAEISNAKKAMQEFAEQTVYSASDMANTYAQLDAVGVKNVEQLVKGIGGLAAASSDPSQAMKSLSTQITQAAGKATIAWSDFKIMLEQAPAGVSAVAKSMGMSASELVSAVQDGTVKTQDFLNAVAKVGTNSDFTALATQYKTVSQAVDGLKENISNGLQASFTNLQAAGIRAIEAITAVIQRLTPVINAVINGITAGINAISNAVAKLMGITLSSGNTGVGTGGTGTSDATAIATESADDLVDAQDKVVNSTNKVAKATKNATKAQQEYNAQALSFDVTHKLGGGSTSSGSSSDDAGSGTVTQKAATAVADTTSTALEGIDAIDTGLLELEDTENKQPGILSGIEDSFGNVVDRVKELAGQFKKGFKFGLDDVTPQVNKIKESFEGIKESWKNIWNDPDVKGAVKSFVSTASFDLGVIAGSGTRIGINLGTNLVAGINKYLEEHQDDIKEKLRKILGNGEAIFDNFADLSKAQANISDVLTSDSAIETTSNVAGIAGAITGDTATLASSIAADISSMFSDPIVENADAIKESTQKTFDNLAGITETTERAVRDTGGTINRVYDDYVHPLMEKVTDTFSGFIAGFTAGWDHIQGIPEMVEQLYDEHIAPLLDSFEEAWAAVSEALQPLMDNVLTPLTELIGFIVGMLAKVAWAGLIVILENLADALKSVFDTIKNVASWAGKFTSKLPSLQGIVDGLTGKNKTTSINGYATGGVVNGAQLFMARENGMAEMVGQIGGATTVMNNDQIVSAVSTGVAQAVAGVIAQQSQDEGQAQDIVITVDSEELARATMRGKKKYNTRTNPQFAFS